MCEEVEEETNRTIPELEHCRLVQPCKDRIYVLVDGSIDINSLLLVQLHDRGSSVPVVGKRRGGWSLVSDIFFKKNKNAFLEGGCGELHKVLRLGYRANWKLLVHFHQLARLFVVDASLQYNMSS